MIEQITRVSNELQLNDSAVSNALAPWFEHRLNKLPREQRRFAEAYIPAWTDLSPGARRAKAEEVDRQRALKLRIKFRLSESAKKRAEQVQRFAQRNLDDGFNSETLPREAKRCRVDLSEEMCIELAHSHVLDIEGWHELTGISIGRHESYIISARDVVFRKWTDDDFAQMHKTEQAHLIRDNKITPLTFPCTPARLVQFIDAAPPGSHSLSLPDVFRQAVTEQAQATDTPPAVSEETPEQSDTAPSRSPAVAPDDGDEQDDAVSDTTGLVAWQAELLERWTEVIAEYGKKPTARQAVQWLKKHGSRLVIPVEQPDRLIVCWIDGEKKPQEVKVVSVGKRISEWRKAGKIPA